MRHVHYWRVSPVRLVDGADVVFLSCCCGARRRQVKRAVPNGLIVDEFHIDPDGTTRNVHLKHNRKAGLP